MARGREKGNACKSNISETSEEPVVGIDHKYVGGENGDNDIFHIAKVLRRFIVARRQGDDGPIAHELTGSGFRDYCRGIDFVW